MDFENEPYVRVYKRRTVNMVIVGWEARAVLREIFLVCDRAGVIELDGVSPAEAVTGLIGDMPIEVVAPALQKLIDRGTVVIANGCLVAPNFDHAQNCKKSDRARQADSRERRRARALAGVSRGKRGRSVSVPIVGTAGDGPEQYDDEQPSQGVTLGNGTSDSTSQDVTEPSQSVTLGHSVLCCAVPNRSDPPIPPVESKPAESARAEANESAPLPIAELCKKLERNPYDAGYYPVQERPELIEFARLWAVALGRGERRLGGYGSDAGVTAVCKLFALGYTVAELSDIAHEAQFNAFCSGKQDGKSKDFCVLKPALAGELLEQSRKRKQGLRAKSLKAQQALERERSERKREADKRSDPKLSAAALDAVVSALRPPPDAPRGKPKRVTLEELDRAIADPKERSP